MLSKNRIKFITSLQKKKFRQKYNKFIVEGLKSVRDIANSKYKVETIYYCNELPFNISEKIETIKIDCKDMKKISLLSTISDFLAVVNIYNQDISEINIENEIILCLDDIQDPGNLGTIIRTANWFGVKNIVCSNNTADLYNPKTIQATMASFVNVNLYYSDLEQFLKNQKALNIFGAFMQGKDIYKQNLPNNAIIVMGNEGKGISKDLEKIINEKLTIPYFSPKQEKPESLNVSTATAVVLSEFMRKK